MAREWMLKPLPGRLTLLSTAHEKRHNRDREGARQGFLNTTRAGVGLWSLPRQTRQVRLRSAP